jgi:serine phosphatase RsbU (regulator of sigma subunit)
MRISVPLLLLLPWFLAAPAGGQNLRLPIANYTNKIYGRNYRATNYCIVTDHRNLVYAGNANGILEYDGSRWHFIPVRQGAYVTSMDVSPSGIIFVGSQQDFGYLDTDPKGALVYRSLSDELPEGDQFFTRIWGTHAAGEFTAFQAEECLYLYRGDSLVAIYPETSFHTSFLVGSRLFIRERERGLEILQGNVLVPVKDGSLFANLGIFGMFPLDGEGRILIATTEKGFYLFDPAKGIERMPAKNDPFLIRAGIFGGTDLADGNIALNTLHEGVLICSPDGRIRAVINKHSGLQVDDVKDMCQDVNRNIWCALDNGISKIDYSSPVSFYYENAGLEGSVHALVRHGGRLYAGTTSGLFAEDRTVALNKSLEFSPAAGIRDQVWSLLSIGNSLLAGCTNGLYLIREGSARKISDMNAFAMLYLEKERLLLVGGSGGLAVFRREGDWKKVARFADIREDIKSIAQNRSSHYNATEIWLGTSLQGTLKMLINPDLSHTTYRYFGAGDGLTEDWVLPMEHRDSIVFGTRAGLMHFIDEYLMQEALPDSLKDNPANYRGYFENRKLYEHDILLPVSYLVDSHKRTWAVIDNEICLIRHDSSQEIIKKPFQGIDLGDINYIYPDGEYTVWFAAGDGLARFDLRRMDQPARDFHAFIRAVVASDDSILFNGSYGLPADYSPGESRELFMQPDRDVPTLDHAFNDVTFYFTSPFYDNENNNQFSWMLEGGKSGWSNWSTRRITSYTNLHEGEYAFLLRAKNIYGDISETASYRFVIRPPFARTALAYTGYAVLLILLVYVAVRLGQRQLKRKNEHLETIVLERTEEIRKQNIKLAAQKKEITDSITYAERIQRAILPRTDRIASQLEGYFILFRPKSIVSGDFYWLAESGDKIVVTAVDCTGHGVPGAFMSMLGVSFLNKIILENNTLQADEILNRLRDNVVKSLKQTGREGEARDGMDMSLVVIDLQKMTMEFAGANNPLYMIRANRLDETKADRMPISYHIDSIKFSSHLIQLNKGDTIYLFSDGYADQFGGPSGKKFKYQAFKNLLFENRERSMDEIKKVLEATLETWRAPQGPDGEIYEQVDDILVIGVRI